MMFYDDTRRNNLKNVIAVILQGCNTKISEKLFMSMQKDYWLDLLVTDIFTCSFGLCSFDTSMVYLATFFWDILIKNWTMFLFLFR